MGKYEKKPDKPKFDWHSNLADILKGILSGLLTELLVKVIDGLLNK